MIYEWTLEDGTRNFGDALYEVLLSPDMRLDWEEDEDHLFFPIGSVICDRSIEDALWRGMQPVFVGCGWRGEPLTTSLAQEAIFVGCRGPMTREELLLHDIDVPVTLDPAYELPGIVGAGDPNALTLVVRHILDPYGYDSDDLRELGADAMHSPAVRDRGDVLRMIRTLSGARFVLAGSMHAAMVAHAYGVPFALLGGDYVDCPPKWEDWLASVGLGDPVFVDSVPEGREWWRSVSG